jgi:chorismate mutase
LGSRIGTVNFRAIRGATCLQQDDAQEMAEAVTELLSEILARNEVGLEDLVSIFFTATPDLHSAFPAAAARGIGLADVPLMCAQELEVVGAMEKVIRVMLHVQTSSPRSEIKHVYLRGAEALRKDIAQ